MFNQGLTILNMAFEAEKARANLAKNHYELAAGVLTPKMSESVPVSSIRSPEA